MKVKFTAISFILTFISVCAGGVKAENRVLSNDNRDHVAEDSDELPVAVNNVKGFFDNKNDNELTAFNDRQLQDCGYRRRIKGGKGYYRYPKNYYGFVSHLNLWNANNDKMGLQAWYKAPDGRNSPRDICNTRNNIQAVIGCDLYVNSVLFRAVHTTSGKVVQRVAKPKPYVMFGIKGTDVLPGTWPELGTYELTVTPYTGTDGDGYAGQKASFSFTVKDCD